MRYDPIAKEHRFFFALLLPIQLARQVANAATWFQAAGSPIAADRLHITLFILPDQFDRSDVLIERLLALGAAVAAAPIDVALDYVSGGSRSIALRPQHRVAGLTNLHRALAEQARLTGIEGRARYMFQPHVTLGYCDGRPFGQRVAPVAWTATEFVLIHSHLGHTRHTILGRWPLIATKPEQGSLF